MLAGIVTDVLVAGGAGGTRADVARAVAHGFEAALYDVVSLALQFQWIAGERIVARDFVVYTVDAGSAFNHVGMEEEQVGSERCDGSRIVVGTTALGVRMEKKVGGERDVPGELRKVVMLKPRVVLVDVV